MPFNLSNAEDHTRHHIGDRAFSGSISGQAPWLTAAMVSVEGHSAGNMAGEIRHPSQPMEGLPNWNANRAAMALPSI